MLSASVAPHTPVHKPVPALPKARAVVAAPAALNPSAAALRSAQAAEGGPSIPGTYEGFRAICSEFLRAIATTNADELEAGVHGVGLAYLSIQWDEDNPLDRIHRAAAAPALMRMVTKAVIEREMALAQVQDEMDSDAQVQTMRCAP